MQELLLVGLIDLAAAALVSVPFWLVFSLRRHSRLLASVRENVAGQRVVRAA